MSYCQKCGRENAHGSVFCRFCGTKFSSSRSDAPPANPAPPFYPQTPPVQPQPANYETAPPRPYSWKTDEYQISDEKPTKVIDRVQPLPIGPPTGSASPSQYQQRPLAAGFHCPKCASRLYPKITRQISTAGWIVFAALLITFFPLFWVGFLIKEDIQVCQICGHKTRI